MIVDDSIFCRSALCKEVECKKHPNNIPKHIPVNVAKLEDTEYCIKNKIMNEM